jgi:hypothetical protein
MPYPAHSMHESVQNVCCILNIYYKNNFSSIFEKRVLRGDMSRGTIRPPVSEAFLHHGPPKCFRRVRKPLGAGLANSIRPFFETFLASLTVATGFLTSAANEVLVVAYRFVQYCGRHRARNASNGTGSIFRE